MTAGKHMGMVKRTVVGSRMLIKKAGVQDHGLLLYYYICMIGLNDVSTAVCLLVSKLHLHAILPYTTSICTGCA